MHPQWLHTHGAVHQAAERRGWEFWLAVLVALIVLLTCTGPVAGRIAALA